MTWISRIDRHKIKAGYVSTGSRNREIKDGYVVMSDGMHKWARENVGRAIFAAGSVFNSRAASLLAVNQITAVRFFKAAPAADVTTVNLADDSSDIAIIGYLANDTELHVYTPASEVWLNANAAGMFRDFENCATFEKVFGNLVRADECTDTSYLLYHCWKLSDWTARNWNLNNVTYAESMFTGCPLDGITFTGWDMSKMTGSTPYTSFLASSTCRMITMGPAAPKVSIPLGRSYRNMSDFTDTTVYTDLKDFLPNKMFLRR